MKICTLFLYFLQQHLVFVSRSALEDKWGNDKSDSNENEVLKTKSTYWTNEELETRVKMCQLGVTEWQPNDIADENGRFSSWNKIY